MESVNNFVINFIFWMIAGIITGFVHLELLNNSSDIPYWISRILFCVVLIGGPILCLMNL